MGLFASMARSWKKSKRLRRLQLAISPPGETTADFAARMLSGDTSAREQALEDFFDLCKADDGVAQVMEIENANRTDLEEIYKVLLLNGLGRWVKGHYAALSTVAYAEPLMFTLRTKAQGTSVSEISFTLLEYWEGKIRQGDLIRHVS